MSRVSGTHKLDRTLQMGSVFHTQADQQGVALRADQRAWEPSRTDAPLPPDHLARGGRQFAIDVRWGGATGNGRATVVARLLEGAGIRGRLTQ
jgi:hypothetical protein